MIDNNNSNFRNKIICGDCLEVLKQIPDESINCCVTSPPYWALRDYGVEGQIGLEPTFYEYLDNLITIFDEVWRVLRKDGTCWVVMGDTYSGSGNGSNDYRNQKTKNYRGQGIYKGQKSGRTSLPDKCLIQIPSRFAIMMTDRGWILRNEIIWCLSEDTMVFWEKDNIYHHTPIKDVEVGGSVFSINFKGEIVKAKIKNVFDSGYKKCKRITTKTGREVVCSDDHVFPYKSRITIGGAYLKFKTKKCSELEIGDCLYVNESLPIETKNTDTYDNGFIVGFFLAEGNYIKNKVGNYKNNKLSKAAQKRWGTSKETKKIVGVQFSCGVKDIERGYIDKLKNYNVKVYQYGNCVHVCSRDKNLLQLIQTYVAGDLSKNKHLKQCAFNQGTLFFQGIVDGILAGDGHYDKKNDRWILGICINHYLVNDLQLLCRLLGYQSRVNYWDNGYSGVAQITIRKNYLQKRIFNMITDPIESIEDAGYIRTYDIELEPIYTTFCGKGKTDKPSIENRKNKWNNLYYLANGIWTHNCKPNAMPSSVKDRFTVDFEKVFFFVKNKKYWFEQQFEPLKNTTVKRMEYGMDIDGKEGHGKYAMSPAGWYSFKDKVANGEVAGRNKRCVWEVSTKPFHGAHFAVFPEDLIEPMIRAGCPEFICKKCGKPREVIIQKTVLDQKSRKPYTAETPWIRHGTGASTLKATTVYEVTGLTDCGCNYGWDKGIVLDPFIGSGTTALVAKQLGRDFIGIELNPEYCKLAEERINSGINQKRLGL